MNRRVLAAACLALLALLMANLIRCQQVYQKAGQVKEAGMSPRGVIFRDVPRTEDTATLVPATFAPDDTVKYYRIPKVGRSAPTGASPSARTATSARYTGRIRTRPSRA
jgi:hypothetical protein